MVAILLAVLGAPLWLVVGIVLGHLYGRPRFKQAPSVFGCKVRLVIATMGPSRTPGTGTRLRRWVHDVPPSPRRRPPTFERIVQTNIVGTFNVFEAARRQGCPRVVFASSLHVTGFYDATQRISPAVPVRPDSFYGVGKACGENLGRLYADKHGLEVVCLRIGTFAEQPTTPRHLSTWLSPRDAVELFYRSLVAPEVGFTVVYGASANQRSWWDPGRIDRLGYRPMDDAEEWAAKLDADADPTESGDGPQGGSYAL
jgi:NAD(P)-dependent dehydrogenase (short-subunit alcohol dehydrogenase family)